jgi:hypothetical protein
MLGRRSSLIGALVQAINIAIHDAIERKARFPKSAIAEIESLSTTNIP